MFYRLTALCFLFATLAVPAHATATGSDELPAWLKQAAAAPAPTYKKDVPAVVLYKEAQVIVGDDGRVTTTTTYAVRLLNREGRGEAQAADVYTPDTGKVRDMRAWLIRPSGDVKRYGKEETLDMPAALDNVYDEVRIKRINASGDAEAGCVFGYQVTSEDRSVFTQSDWNFQDNLPTLLSRYTLTLPAGWRAVGVTFNHADIEPTMTGATYAWELRDLPFIEDEPSSPSLSNIVPRMAVSYYPAAGSPAMPGKTFEKWTDVARWLSELEDSQATIDDPLAAKARELTANAKTEFEKIQAIGRYVQNVRYISIQTGVGRGGGYRPHLATDVFAKSYGDCKDKANLMRAMLKAVKVDSFLVSIYSGDPDYVRAEWPSPQQFNHCIIAIKVSDGTQAATVVQHPALGRLLIFDPTDENTTVGDLPEYEQGSLALIDSPSSEALLRMPVTPPEANRWEGNVEASLESDGSIVASVRERMVGHSAASVRGGFKGLSRPDFIKVIEHWVSHGATGAKFTKIEPTDGHADGRFALDIDFSADSYAQSMQNRLFVFKPAIFSRSIIPVLSEPTRKHPIMLHSVSYAETARFKLPAGFEVDELPDALKLDSPYGTYSATYEVKDGQLLYTRSLVQHRATIPAEQYDQLRKFFGRIRATEESPVVLAKK
ncbi:MAG: DUF3857 and transglutaminase domain-containing protein [Pyrinomonadaceae bacterium]